MTRPDDRDLIALVERLSDAAMRAGDAQVAIEGYAAALRLRAALGEWSESDVAAKAGEESEAWRAGLWQQTQ